MPTLNFYNLLLDPLHPRHRSSPGRIPDIPNDPIEYITGKRGARNVVWMGYRYTRERQREDRSYWKCTLQHHGCTGRLVLNGDIPCKLQHPYPQPCNGDQQAEIAVHQGKQTLKQKAATTEMSNTVCGPRGSVLL